MVRGSEFGLGLEVRGSGFGVRGFELRSFELPSSELPSYRTTELSSTELPSTELRNAEYCARSRDFVRLAAIFDLRSPGSEERMAQNTAASTVHDVVVVGSGAGGGTVTKVLADLGVSVLLMEAGPMLNMADLKEHMWPYNVPHRGAGPKGEAYSGRPTGFTYSATYGGAQLAGEPYTVAPGSDFSWFRSRILGGRTNHYGRVTLRFADYDFKPTIARRAWLRLADRYEDLAPYYDKAEQFIGVIGTVENIRSAPDGIFDKPAALRAHDTLVQRSCAKLNIRAVPARQAVTTSAEKRAAWLSLLRPVRPRLHDGVQLRLELRADLPGDEDRPRAGPRQRHGARAHHRCDRQGHRGLVHRQDRRDRETSAVPHGRPGGERVRVVAAASQLEVAATSAGARELVRHGRPISDGHRRLEHVGVGARAIGHAALQLRRLRLAPLRAVVGLGQSAEARTSRAATTSKSAAATGCRASARSPASSIAPKATA